MHELTALENDNNFDEVLLLQELHRLLSLHVQVMLASADAQSNALYRGLFGILSLLLLLLFDLVEVLPIVHDPAHWWLGLGGNFYEVGSSLTSQSDGLLDRKKSKLLIIHADDANG